MNTFLKAHNNEKNISTKSTREKEDTDSVPEWLLSVVVRLLMLEELEAEQNYLLST